MAATEDKTNLYLTRHHATSPGEVLPHKKLKKAALEMKEFPPERIRNFSIIAHIDHGKSTLADRLLEITGTISATEKNEQVLDKLQVERERGITVKAQTATMVYHYKGEPYLLNLIDTPGHVDFNYEVARSLSACQGVILLIDSNQGVQAQTVANFYLAFEADLSIVPVMNKIDLKVAQPDLVAQQIHNVFDIDPGDVLRVSAKLGTGVEEVLKTVIEKIPPPSGDVKKPLKALLFDSGFDRYRGAVCNIAVIDGAIRKGDRVMMAHGKKSYEVSEVGILYPDESFTYELYAGQVGYLCAGMKTAKEAQVGETLYHQKHPVEPLPGFKAARPMVFAGVYAADQGEYTALRNAIDKLTLNDSSVEVNIDTSAALGQGWRLGFLGLLHMEVFCQRLEQEYDTSVIITTPNVPYKVKIHGTKNIKFYGKDMLTILNPCHLPDSSITVEYQEPLVKGTVITPDDYISTVTSLIMDRRGEIREQSYIDNKRLMITATFPLNEIIVDFFDELKSTTSGYASFDYEDSGYRKTELVKVQFLLNGQEVEELTQISHVSKARQLAKRIVSKLTTNIPRQMFEIAVQGKVGGTVLSRENIKAYRKDVTAKLYGGDVTRRQKLLRQQAEGKKKMRIIGQVRIPKDAFLNILKR